MPQRAKECCGIAGRGHGVVFIGAFICAMAVAAIGASAIKKYAFVLYACALVLDGAVVAFQMEVLPPGVAAAVHILARECAVAAGIFAAVMFAGAFSRDGRLCMAL